MPLANLGDHRTRPRIPRAQAAASGSAELGRLPSAPMRMAVLLLVALGGALWLVARRFLRSNVRRLHGGGDAGLMRGKTVLITGANSGLGRATAAALLRMGARVVMGCRDRARAEAVAAELRRDLRGGGDPGPDPDGGAGELVVRELDLASLRSVRAFCREMLQVWSPRSPARGPGGGAGQGRGAVTLGRTEARGRNDHMGWGQLGSRGPGGWVGPSPVSQDRGEEAGSTGQEASECARGLSVGEGGQEARQGVDCLSRAHVHVARASSLQGAESAEGAAGRGPWNAGSFPFPRGGGRPAASALPPGGSLAPALTAIRTEVPYLACIGRFPTCQELVPSISDT